ncbi:hypothetical protein DFO66_11370 [Brevibacterium sanguinis]|uniref:DUF559 domain-containing protein n=2 Tax=Brevibacterium TaxID=1696 RepID=A0A366IGJ9_9MICO|nr:MULTISPECIES: hypothetical protein [Brevibacterium]RBP62807.1 hypothetical protein DFO66_11370 [Brevibacterium sanguinis]RBP69372.1 hypothetical protein DFO65_11370 [Brevibacterium celere]
MLHEIHRDSDTSYPAVFGDIRDRTEWLKVLIRSYANELLPDAVFSHISAAIIHGLDPPFPVVDHAEMIRTQHHRKKPTVNIRARKLTVEETTQIRDLPVTTVERTLLDIAHDYPIEASVPLISTALRSGLVSSRTLEAGIRHGRSGAAEARRAMDLADPRHESAGEALCAVNFHRHGIDGMIPQVDSYDERGNWIARNDFRHKRLPLVVEVHGVGKYYLNDDGPDRASKENHQRHMRLRNAGLLVFDLVWADLFRTREFLRIRSALESLEREDAAGNARSSTERRTA